MAIELIGSDPVLFVCVCDDCGFQSDMMEIPADTAISSLLTTLCPHLWARGWYAKEKIAYCSVCRGKHDEAA